MADIQSRIDEGAKFYQAQEFDKAIDSLESAVSDEPRNWEAWRLLGFVLNSKGDNEKATKAFEKAIEINPRDPDNYFGLALVWRDLGDLQKSIIYYEKCFHEDPHHQGARGTVAPVYEARGEELEKALNLLGAEQYYEKAYKVSHSEEHYNRLLEYYDRSGQGYKSMEVEREWRMRHNIPEPPDEGPGANAPVMDQPVYDQTQSMPADGQAAPPVATQAPGQAPTPGPMATVTPAGTSGPAPAQVQQTGQGNFMACPSCHKPMKITANICPHCGGDVRRPTGSMSGQRQAAEKKTWQEVAFRVICWIWIAQGAYSVISSLVTMGKGGEIAVAGSTVGIAVGALTIGMGIGLLLEWRPAITLAYIGSILNIITGVMGLLGSALIFALSPVLGIVMVILNIISVALSGFFLYLLSYVGDTW